MKRSITSGLIATTLLSATLLASPMLFAGSQGDREGAPRHERLCQDFREGSGKFSDEARKERRQKYEQRRAEIADRLELTPEQREIWKQIHEEDKARRDERKQHWHQKMKERCGDAGNGPAAGRGKPAPAN